MIALTSLVLAVASSFGGGTVDDLAKSLADATNKNAVIVTGDAVPKLAAFSYDASTADSLSTTIKKGSGLSMCPGLDPIFSDRFYVGDHFRQIAPELPQGPSVTKKIPDDMLKGGKVTLQTAGGSPIAISAIAEIKWSRPVQVDLLLRDLAVSASVKDMPERDFLSAVAKAAGAFLAADDAGYKLTYDAEQLRVRLVATLQQEKANAPLQMPDVKRAFYIATINLLTTDALMVIFETAGETPRLDVLPNTDLATASIAYIRAYESVISRPLGGTPDGGAEQLARGQQKTDILREIDNRARVHLRLNANGEIILSVPVIRGRTSSYIEL